MTINLINPGDNSGSFDCNEKSPLMQNLNEDIINKNCGACKTPSLNDVDGVENSWFNELDVKDTNAGHAGNCDPMQTGHIINDPNNPNPDVIYRYPKGIRGCNQAMYDLFSDLVVIDSNSKVHRVPIIYGTQERAVAEILQSNVRKDETLVVDRITLPMLSIYNSDMQYNQNRFLFHQALDYRIKKNTGKPGFTNKERHERDTVFGVARGVPIDMSYTLYAWTSYLEDMNQILEQIFTKFSLVAYINVRGVPWEVIVKLNSTANNIDIEPGDQNLRIIKYQFNLTAETYIPQPIVRKKSVLAIKTDFFNSVNVEEINDVFGRLEESVKELKVD